MPSEAAVKPWRNAMWILFLILAVASFSYSVGYNRAMKTRVRVVSEHRESINGAVVGTFGGAGSGMMLREIPLSETANHLDGGYGYTDADGHDHYFAYGLEREK